MAPAPGMVVAGSFELLRPLDGGAGRVWLARDKALLRNVALKFQRNGARGRAALLAEAAILSRCDHPSIVQFYRTYASAPSEPAFYAMKACGAPAPHPNPGSLPLAATLAPPQVFGIREPEAGSRRGIRVPGAAEPRKRLPPHPNPAANPESRHPAPAAWGAAVASALAYLHALSPPA